jgi:hypothetical protein
MVSPKSLLGKFLGIDYATGDLTGQGPSGVLVPILRGGNNNVAVVTATSVAITRDSHDMKDIVLNRAGGIVVNLPAATAATLGAKFNFYIPTSLSGTTKIKAANAADTIMGRVQVDASLASNAPTSFSAGSTADTISLNGTTTGGKKGDHFALTVVASNQWAAYGEIQATGASATPFVVSVS